MNVVKRLSLNKFTAFSKADFHFSPGINVLIGENSTGKTHVLKLVYALLAAMNKVEQNSTPKLEVSALVWQKLAAIFKVGEFGFSSLIRAGSGNRNDRSAATATLHLANSAEIALRMRAGTASDESDFLAFPQEAPFPPTPPALYLPSRELLSIYPGFMAAYQHREVAFDETYYDLCLALSANPLRDAAFHDVENLLAPLEEIFAGRPQISRENERFYVELPDAGKLEAHLVAEGYRKLATLAYLLRNGSLGPEMVLLWDEPEANLNPKLVTAVVDFLITLTQANVQIFLATHNYLISHELSLRAEYEQFNDIRFFSLYRQNDQDGVLVEDGENLVEIENNPILEGYVAHSEREDRLFYESVSTGS